MSLWNRGVAVRVAVRGGAVLVVLAFLSGCGFQPVYGAMSRSGGGDGAAGLSLIRVNPMSDRPGQILRHSLQHQMQPQGLAVQPRYALDIDLGETRQDLGLQRDATTSLARLTVVAHWRLTEIASGTRVTSGRSQASMIYPLARNGFTNIVTENDIRERALGDIAHDIVNRLAMAMAASAS